MRTSISPVLAALVLAPQAFAAAPAIPPAALPSYSNPKGLGGALLRQKMKIIGRNDPISTRSSGALGTDFSATGRAFYKNKGQLSVLRVFYGNHANQVSEVASQWTPYLNRSSLEYGSITPLYFSFNGIEDAYIPANTYSPGVWSDSLGVNIAAGSTFYVRTFRRVAAPPTSGSATAFSGGALTTATTYYYKLTTVDGGIESGGSSEITCTVSSPNLSCSLSWTAPSYGQFVNVYRATTTGAEKFLGEVPVAQTSFADIGLVTPNANVSAPSQTAIALERYNNTLNGEGVNTPSHSGNGSDQTATTGTINSGIWGAYTPTPSLLLGDDWANPAIAILGDSICNGTGIMASVPSPYTQYVSNWFEQGIMEGEFAGEANLCVASTSLAGLLTDTQAAPWRLQALKYADYVIGELGRNDLSSSTWQTIASQQLQIAALVTGNGARYVLTTLLPATASTDDWTTAANQSVTSFESVRTNYNTWIRNGSLIDGSGNPVLTGGTPSPFIWKYFDAAAAVEVNASNVLTQNGGRWQSPTGASYTGQVLTGTPTTTSLPVSTASYPTGSPTNPGLGSMFVHMTSGAASGQWAMVKSNTSTTLTLYANADTSLTGIAVTGLTATPTTGDNFDIWQTYVVDGTHPSLLGHQTVGAAWGAWATANIVPFGAMLGAAAGD